MCCNVQHMATHRVSVSLPDDLYQQVKRVAAASRVSEASIIRAVVAELIPRTTRVLDFLGSEPKVTPEDVATVDAWGEQLERFLESTPPVLRPMTEGLHFRSVEPPDTGAEDGAS